MIKAYLQSLVFNDFQVVFWSCIVSFMCQISPEIGP